VSDRRKRHILIMMGEWIAWGAYVEDCDWEDLVRRKLIPAHM